MLRSLWVKLSLVMMVTVLAGCMSGKTVRVEDAKVDLAAEAGAAGSALITSAVQKMTPARTILATSFVNIDDLQYSSTFGRLMGDTIAGDLVGRGFNVTEVRLRESLFMQPRIGEFMLSRELRNVGAAHDAQAVLVGTYAVGGEYVYVNARLVSVTTSQVLSSYDFRVPLNRDIRKMLSSQRRR